ncbi:MAG: hypothetical protein ACI9N3_001225, partial [Colwellia sp.]
NDIGEHRQVTFTLAFNPVTPNLSISLNKYINGCNNNQPSHNIRFSTYH